MDAIKFKERAETVLGRQGISPATIRKAGLKFHVESEEIEFPIDSSVSAFAPINPKAPCRYEGARLYPPTPVRKNGDLVVVWDVRHALALSQIGLNACAVTSEDLDDVVRLIPPAKMITTILTAEQFDAADEIRRALLIRGDHVKVVLVPGGMDITEYLDGHEEADDRLEAFDALCLETVEPEILPAFKVCNGIQEKDGRLVDTTRGHVLTEFTGRCVQLGRTIVDRRGGRGNVGSYGIYALRHHDGGELTVRIDPGDSLSTALRKHPGFEPKWAMAGAGSEVVRVWMDLATESHVLRVDERPHAFGYEDPQRFRFETKSTTITAQAVGASEFVRVAPDYDILSRFDLPVPGQWSAKEDAEAVFSDFLGCHLESVTMPLLASALFAPIRRRFCPDEERFGLLLTGQAGCGKTSRARLAQSFFGSFPTDDLVFSAALGSQAIRSMLSGVGDAIAVVDGLRLPKATDSRRWQEEVDLMSSFALSDFAFKKRTKDELYAAPKTDGGVMTIITGGPALAADASLLRRCLPVEMDSINLVSSTESACFERLKQTRRHLPAFTAGFVRFALANDVGWLECLERARTAIEVALGDYSPNWRQTTNAQRVKDRVSHMLASMFFGIRYANHVGIKTETLADLHMRARVVFGELAKRALHMAQSVFPELSIEGWASKVAEAVDQGKEWIEIRIHNSHRKAPKRLGYPYRPTTKRAPVAIIEIGETKGGEGFYIPWRGKNVSMMWRSGVGGIVKDRTYKDIKVSLEQHNMMEPGLGELRYSNNRGCLLHRSLVDLSFMVLGAPDAGWLVAQAAEFESGEGDFGWLTTPDEGQ